MPSTQPNSPVKGLSPKEAQEIVDHIAAGGVLRHFKGITKQETEIIYDLGYQYYQTHKYEDAEKIFQLLCLYDHLETKFWVALGATLQLLKRYERAISVYSYSALIDPNDPRPPLHAAECYLALNNKDKAISALESAIQAAGDKPVNKSQRSRAEALMKLLGKTAE